MLWVAAAFVACGGGNSTSFPDPPSEFKQDISPMHKFWEKGEWYFEAWADTVRFRGRGKEQRIFWDGLKVTMMDSSGWAIISAASGIAIHPFTGVTLKGVSVEITGGITITGDQLDWPVDDDRTLAFMEAPTYVLAPDYVLEGKNITAAVDFSSYAIDKVVSFENIPPTQEEQAPPPFPPRRHR